MNRTRIDNLNCSSLKNSFTLEDLDCSGRSSLQNSYIFTDRSMVSSFIPEDMKACEKKINSQLKKVQQNILKQSMNVSRLKRSAHQQKPTKFRGKKDCQNKGVDLTITSSDLQNIRKYDQSIYELYISLLQFYRRQVNEKQQLELKIKEIDKENMNQVEVRQNIEQQIIKANQEILWIQHEGNFKQNQIVTRMRKQLQKKQ